MMRPDYVVGGRLEWAVHHGCEWISWCSVLSSWHSP